MCAFFHPTLSTKKKTKNKKRPSKTEIEKKVESDKSLIPPPRLEGRPVVQDETGWCSVHLDHSAGLCLLFERRKRKQDDGFEIAERKKTAAHSSHKSRNGRQNEKGWDFMYQVPNKNKNTLVAYTPLPGSQKQCHWEFVFAL